MTTIYLQELIDNKIQSLAEPPRGHMGCSQIGHSCERYLWLSFRWAVIQKFEGRMLRLFRRGQIEEESIINDLKSIGARFGKAQDGVNFGSHVSGSVDGIIESGLPGYETKRFVTEFKTHSKKSFDDLIKKGVFEAKPLHWVQMQTYMIGKKIGQALYVAVCKDDDRIHSEIVEFNEEKAKYYVDRAKRIALSDRMPEPMTTNSTWYECKFCPAWDMCFGSKMTKEVNCRTCAHSTATIDSQVTCARYDNEPMPIKWQHQGCEQHVLHPDLVPWQRAESANDNEAVYIIDGKHVRNGEPCGNVFSSKELLANPVACANQDDTVQALRETFDARIIDKKSVDMF